MLWHEWMEDRAMTGVHLAGDEDDDYEEDEFEDEEDVDEYEGEDVDDDDEGEVAH